MTAVAAARTRQSARRRYNKILLMVDFDELIRCSSIYKLFPLCRRRPTARKKESQRRMPATKRKRKFPLRNLKRTIRMRAAIKRDLPRIPLLFSFQSLLHNFIFHAVSPLIHSCDVCLIIIFCFNSKQSVMLIREPHKEILS